MLSPFAVTAFVRPDTIAQIEDYSRRRPAVFTTRSEVVGDHRGESGTLCTVRAARAEMELAPFNHFHYLYDFEIGLSINSDYGIDDLEETLSNHGYDFESGFFDDERREYFLIPRKQGVFTPFAVGSYQQTKHNPHLDSIRRLRVELPEESIATTEDFIRCTSIRDYIDIEIEVGPRRRFISVLFDIDAPARTDVDVRFDGLHIRGADGQLSFSAPE